MAMDHPKISIITTVYKTGHYLPLTVQMHPGPDVYRF